MNNLKKIVGIEVNLIRQHYLRWNHLTPSIESSISLKIDSTIGYTEALGFRSGTCMKYEMFCLETRRHLKIEQQPLIMMDHAILSLLKKHSKKEFFLKELDNYYLQIKRVGGTLTILWHNSEMKTCKEKNLFHEIIQRYKC